MTPAQTYRYYKSFFLTMRPDLTDLEYQTFSKRFISGEQFLNNLRKFLNFESARITYLYPHSARLDKTLNFADQFYQLNTPFILGHRANANRNWEDASKVVSYFETQLQKIIKYGLDYPTSYLPNTEQELLEREDEIYNRFVREMRRPPFQTE